MKERSGVFRRIARVSATRLRSATVTGVVGLVLVFPPVANTADRLPPLKGGVEKSDRERQREGYCQRFGASIDPYKGQLQIMPKAGQGNRDFCLAPRADWTLLGEDRNYCCFFAPRDWVPKIPPLPGNVQQDQPAPKDDPTGDLSCRGTYTECFGHSVSNPAAPPGFCVYDVDPAMIADMLRAHPDVCSRYSPSQLICQALPDGCSASPPFYLGASYDFTPGRSIHFEATDAKGISHKVQIAVDNGGGAPTEPGFEAEWKKWYEEWIRTVTLKVHVPLKSNFFADGNKYRTYTDYTVYPDGRVRWDGGEAWSSNRSKQHGAIVDRETRTKKLRAPPFPKGSKLQFVQRRFTFEHNMGSPEEVRLAGPPQG